MHTERCKNVKEDLVDYDNNHVSIIKYVAVDENLQIVDNENDV